MKWRTEREVAVQGTLVRSKTPLGIMAHVFGTSTRKTGRQSSQFEDSLFYIGNSRLLGAT